MPTSFKEMVQRVVNVEVKKGLRSSIMVWNADFCCPRGHRPSHNIFAKVQTQDLTAKESKPEESSQGNQSRPMKSPPHPAPMSLPSLLAKKRRRSIKRKSKTRKSLLWELGTMPLRMRRKRATENTIIA